MNRRHTLAALSLTLLAPLGLAAAPSHPAYAAASASASTQRVTWLTELGSFSLDAPRGWRVTRPAEHTGRVTSPDGATRLSLTELGGTTTVAAAAARRVAAIEALDDTTVLGTTQGTVRPTTSGYAGGVLSVSSLRYRWVDSSGRARLVLSSYVGLDTQQRGGPRAYYEVTVSGPTDQAQVLRATLPAATSSVFSTP